MWAKLRAASGLVLTGKKHAFTSSLSSSLWLEWGSGGPPSWTMWMVKWQESSLEPWSLPGAELLHLLGCLSETGMHLPCLTHCDFGFPLLQLNGYLSHHSSFKQKWTLPESKVWRAFVLTAGHMRNVLLWAWNIEMEKDTKIEKPRWDNFHLPQQVFVLFSFDLLSQL